MGWATPKGEGKGGNSRGQENYRSNGEDDGADDRRIFVGQLTRDVDAGELKYIFEEVGDIVSFRLLSDKGVAYVTFARASDARKAVNLLDGKWEDGISRGEGMTVQFAQR